MASPDLAAWRLRDGSVPGIEASWVDATRVGIPSDYFYYAAKWPVLPRLASSHTCTPTYERVIVDHRPMFAPHFESFGDFAAHGMGTCQHDGEVNRWMYFVAAPSFGPVGNIGLPNSGLYMVVAVIHDGPKAQAKLRKVLFGTKFGTTTSAELMYAARQSAKMG
jgi:hypothetical protein